MNTPLVLIGTFDPTLGPVAWRNMLFAETLALEGPVHCVTDDLDLLPARTGNEGPMYLHRRSFLKDAALAALPRLHLAGGSAGDYLLDDSLCTAPGGLVLFTDTLFEALVDAHRQKGDWPHAFANWLVRTEGAAGGVIAESLVLRHRWTPALGIALPGLGPIAALADAVYAASPQIDTALKADGIRNATLLPPPPLKPATPPTATRPSPAGIVIALATPDARVTQAAAEIERLGRDVRLLVLPPEREAWPGLMAEAHLAIDLANDPAPGWSPFLRAAAEAGLPLVHAHATLPATAGIGLEHAEAHHALVAAIGALVLDPVLAKDRAGRLHACLSGLCAGGSLRDRLKTLPVPRIEKPAGPAQASATYEPEASGAPKGRSLLVGAAPGPALMARLWPGVDAVASPRFATPALAGALAAATGLTAPVLLARLGFEAPLVACAQDLDSVSASLRSLDSIASAASPWAGGAPLQFVPAGPLADSLWRVSAAGGMIWTLEDGRRTLRCLILAGSNRALYLENRGNIALRIASRERTFSLSPGDREPVLTESAGQMDLRIRLEGGNTQAQARALLDRWLAAPDLWMTP